MLGPRSLDGRLDGGTEGRRDGGTEGRRARIEGLRWEVQSGWLVEPEALDRQRRAQGRRAGLPGCRAAGLPGSRSAGGQLEVPDDQVRATP
jgi:hypothetical protein